MHILLLDDNPDDRALAARHLSRALPGIAIEEIGTEADYQKALRFFSFDLVITDYHMYWTDGLTVVQDIKSLKPECPVIMFTGTGNEEIAVRAMKSGVDEYIIKSPDHFNRLTSVVKNIMDKKNKESALKDAETRYQNLFDAVPVGFYRTHPDGSILNVNMALVQMLKYPDRETLLKANVQDTYASLEDKARWRTMALQAGVIRGYHMQWRCYDGSLIWVEDNARVCRDENGNVLYYEGSVIDITERKKMEAELIRVHEIYRDAIENAEGVPYLLNYTTDSYEFFGKGCEDLIGLPPDGLRRSTLQQMVSDIIVTDPEGPHNPDHYERAFKNGKIQRYRCDFQIVTPKGQVKWLNDCSIPVRDETTGKVIGSLGILYDITTRKLVEKDLRESLDKLQRTLHATVNALASAVEKRDPYTAGHQKRVAELATAIARAMGLSQDTIVGLYLTCLIHDIGKLYVPAEILSKPGALSGIEYSMIKNHPEVGHDILKEIEFPVPVSDIVMQHHERINGTGYPRGLKKDGILLEARILAVADVVEAMLSHRPYRPQLGITKSLEEINNYRGLLYDEDVVDICIHLFTSDGFSFS